MTNFHLVKKPPNLPSLSVEVKRIVAAELSSNDGLGSPESIRGWEAVTPWMLNAQLLAAVKPNFTVTIASAVAIILKANAQK